MAVATLSRESAQLHPRLRSDLLLAAALLHDVGRVRELDRAVLAEILHAVGSHHDARAARTAEAAVLYHANQLDAVAATRSVDPEA